MYLIKSFQTIHILSIKLDYLHRNVFGTNVNNVFNNINIPLVVRLYLAVFRLFYILDDDTY